MEISSLN